MAIKNTKIGSLLEFVLQTRSVLFYICLDVNLLHTAMLRLLPADLTSINLHSVQSVFSRNIFDILIILPSI
jgi:hypothetical protein